MLSSLVRVHTPTGYCSGVLIDPYFILTARHFLRHRTAGDMFVFGDHWNRTVSGWIDLATTDISVLRLARPIMEADHPAITPPPLPTAASLPPPSATAWAVENPNNAPEPYGLNSRRSSGKTITLECGTHS